MVSLLIATRRKTDLVEFFVELFKLSSFGHYFLVHEEGRLNLLISSFTQKVETIGDEGLVEVNTIICEEVATVSGYFCALR
jgi:hypothetical protein